METKLNHTLAIANTIIIAAENDGLKMTHLKLQCLMYLLNKKYLQTTGKPIFGVTDDAFHVGAWGPLLPSAYNVFKKHGSQLIESVFSDERGNVYRVLRNTQSDLYDALDWVWGTYRYHSAWQLSDILTSRISAWKRAGDEKKEIIPSEYIMEESWVM